MISQNGERKNSEWLALLKSYTINQPAEQSIISQLFCLYKNSTHLFLQEYFLPRKSNDLKFAYVFVPVQN